MQTPNQTEQYWQKEQGRKAKQIQQLFDLLEQSKDFDIQLNNNLLEKIKYLQEEAKKENRKLRVVFVGGVSEGKSTLIASWLGKINAASEKEFKIAMEESSSEVNIYQTEHLELVDTPGLFGHKKDIDGVYYKDKTREYLSKSDLIIYVMSSKNSIKDSHKEKLHWLFVTLDLLPRTVFVLSRFDDIVDIKDPEEYALAFDVKKQALLEGLSEVSGISSSKLENIHVIAMSANPQNKGLGYWGEHREEYDKISRINALQDMTTDKIKEQGGEKIIAIQTQGSILRDITETVLPQANQKFEESKDKEKALRAICKALREDMEDAKTEISRARVALRDAIVQYFSRLITETKGVSLETINEFFEREVGNKGIIVSANVDNIFENNTRSCYMAFETLSGRFENERNALGDFVQTYGKGWLQGAGEWIKGVDANTIKTARDFIAPNFKFAPWEAVNISKDVVKYGGVVVTILGIGLEIWESLAEAKKQKKLEETKDIMIKNFEDNREQILDFIKSPEFEAKCFNYIKQIEEKISNGEKECEALRKKCAQFEKWRYNFEQLSHEIFPQLPMEQRPIEG